jgi:Arc-like DNA binding domain
MKTQIRMPEALHAELARIADAAGRSLNAEMVGRLAMSLNNDARLGGPDLQAIANTFIGAFVRGGRNAALAAGHPEWGTLEWLMDETCYKAGLITALQTLIAMAPPWHMPQGDLTEEGMRQFFVQSAPTPRRTRQMRRAS